MEEAEAEEDDDPQPQSPGPPEEDDEDGVVETGSDLTHQWEPPLDHEGQSDIPMFNDIDLEDDELYAFEDRVHAKEVLWQDPVEVPFGGQAGAPLRNADQPDHNQYCDVINASDNPNTWHPFSSRLEWEFAQWAKMRGPGSTAVTELLNIKGVILLPLISVIC